jgi:hypothetical protein
VLIRLGPLSLFLYSFVTIYYTLGVSCISLSMFSARYAQLTVDCVWYEVRAEDQETVKYQACNTV